MDVNLANALKSGIDAAKLIEEEKVEINAKIDELTSLIIEQLNQKCKIEKRVQGAITSVVLVARGPASNNLESTLFSYEMSLDGYPISLYNRSNSEDLCFDKDQLVHGLMDIVSTSSFGSILIEARKFSKGNE